MAVTTKANSAIYHLKTALSGMEKASVHLIQAKTALPKKDVVSRDAVNFVSEVFKSFESNVQRAIDIIEANNPSESKEE